MELLCKQEMPFEYKIYKSAKNINLSDEVINEFNHFYSRIKESDNVDIDGWKKEYEDISKLVISAVRKKGDKKSKHVYQEQEFIFYCSYFLIKNNKVSQKTLASIWGMRENQFSTLDIYPFRSYEAYTKKTDKLLSPLKEISTGTKIAKCINTRVQAVHACWAFVGITNDLDVFANISTTDTKAFVLTSPLEFSDTESGQRANYAFARYLFANGNRFFDDEGKHVPAGRIKEKIISLLNLQDILMLEQDSLLKEILMSNKDVSAYLTDGDYTGFEALREKYQSAVEVVKIKDEMLESGEVPHGIGYDPRFGARMIDEDEIWTPPVNENAGVGLSNEEIVTAKAEEAQRQIDILEPQLIGSLNIRKMLAERKGIYETWIRFIKDSVKKKSIILQPTYENRIMAAASFWIAEVFKNQEVDTECVDKVLEHLKRKDFLTYIDALMANPAGKMKNARQDCAKHIYMIPEEGDILKALQSQSSIKLTQRKVDESRPLMIYIDREAHSISQQDIKRLSENVEALIIVHDNSKAVEGMGMQMLDDELGLYILSNMEEGNGKR